MSVPALPPCPRCSQPFRCGARDGSPCACVGLVIEPALAAELKRRYDDCLCTDCLRALGASLRRAEPAAPPQSAA